MKVLLINGSPNVDGCTNRALSEICVALTNNGIESEIISIGTKPIAGCIACRGCAKTQSRCQAFKNDDVFNAIASALKDADGLIVGSPVYYASPNGSLISLLDRLFYSCGNDLLYKPAAAVASARRAGTTATLDMLCKYFANKQMPMVSSCYWNMVHGSTPSDVEQDIEGLQTMRVLGNNMAWLLKCIELGKKQGIQPVKEDKIFTNFIR